VRWSVSLSAILFRNDDFLEEAVFDFGSVLAIRLLLRVGFAALAAGRFMLNQSKPTTCS
jgi:hypothetical protein